jgi:O-methyltransferase involved in polyketide biosynthesis
MKFLPADFDRKTLRQILLDGQAYDRSANTLHLAEGVLMYLNPEDVDAIFAFFREDGGRTCRVIFTFMEPQTNGLIRFKNSSWTVNFWLWMRSEVFKWGIAREDLQGYLESRGFRLQDLSTPETFLKRYLSAEQSSTICLAEGEDVCVAERL